MGDKLKNQINDSQSAQLERHWDSPAPENAAEMGTCGNGDSHD